MPNGLTGKSNEYGNRSWTEVLLMLDSRSSRSLTEFTDDKENDHSVNPTRLLSGTVSEVKDELESVHKSRYPDILEREKQWKNRKTIVEYLESEIEDIPEANEGVVRYEIARFMKWLVSDPDYCRAEKETVVETVYIELRNLYAFIEKEFVEEQLEELLEQGRLYKKDGFVYLNKDNIEGDA
jgi:hypothetical protein